MPRGAVVTKKPGRAESRNKGGRPKVPNPKRQVISLRGSEEWREWLNGLADHCRIPATALIDVALTRYAKEAGYEEPPPKR